jgi:glycosyltransferase involved in cell wall biosynthesis
MMMHVTGSDLRFSNRVLRVRLDALEDRRGVRLQPRREMPPEQVDAFEKNCARADGLSLIGNQVTKGTFPLELQKRIRIVPVTGSPLKEHRDPRVVELRNEFLWFGGGGAVHKGLDLVLEVFSRNPDLMLHVVGPYEREKDFVEAYSKELYGLPNIRSHGYLDPSSEKFRRVTRNVIGHIFPSCSEGISPAAVTCMQFGFLPILSVNAGIDLTSDMGFMLVDNSLSEIDQVIKNVVSMERKLVAKMIERAQEYALDAFSRRRFKEVMSIHCETTLGRH